MYDMFEKLGGNSKMQEIKTENEAGLKVYINGVPKIKDIPPEITERLISFLGQEILRK